VICFVMEIGVSLVLAALVGAAKLPGPIPAVGYVISVHKSPSSFKSLPECRTIILALPCRLSVVRPI
jgi:hypothetical protein